MGVRSIIDTVTVFISSRAEAAYGDELLGMGPEKSRFELKTLFNRQSHLSCTDAQFLEDTVVEDPGLPAHHLIIEPHEPMGFDLVFCIHFGGTESKTKEER